MNNRIAADMAKLIGHTPMIKIKSLSQKSNVFGKLESFNPGGSIKDRVALSIVNDAKDKGLIHDGSTLIVPTSGNTGLAIAFICASRGYKAVITMPDNMSIERINMLKAYGAEVILTPGKGGMSASIEKAEQLKLEIADSFIVDQFDNPANPLIHEQTTAVEIWEATKGEVDVVVSGVGTGGTITGVGRFLKQMNSNIKMVAVEPYDSAVLSGGSPNPHLIQGIGAGFVPKVLDVSIIDHIIKVKSSDAFETCRMLSKKEGMFLGISSGAAAFAALEYANTCSERDLNIVVILPDDGNKYMSSGIWS